MTIVIGHATFCSVVVFNNIIARLGRLPGSLAEASMDLGARGWQTLLRVTLPMTATALISAALLTFALSSDEVIVAVFTAGAQNTLPLWMFGAPARAAVARGQTPSSRWSSADADSGCDRRAAA